MRGRILLLVPLALAACLTDPPYLVEDAAGSVRAWSEADASELHARARSLTGPVAARLGVEPLRFVVRVRRGELGQAAVLVRSDAEGRELERWIELGDDARPYLATVIAHELVHWHVRGTAWARLPVALEEGLATTLSLELTPDLPGAWDALLHEALPQTRAVGWDVLLTLPVAAWQDTRFDEHAWAPYPLGAWLVERIGVDALRALCERAEAEGLALVPVDWLLGAARLPESAEERELALEQRWARPQRVVFRARSFEAAGNELSWPAGHEAGAPLELPPGAVRIEIAPATAADQNNR